MISKDEDERSAVSRSGKECKSSEEFHDAQEHQVEATNGTSCSTSSSNQQLIPRNSSFLENFSAWSGSTYKLECTLKFAQYSIWLISKLASSSELRKMYTQISNSRYVMRFMGGPLTLHAIKTGSWSGNWEDKRIHKLTDIMAWSMLFYYPFEHMAFTKWICPRLIRINAERHSAISCRFWGLYVIADMGAVVAKLIELGAHRKRILLKKEKKSISEKVRFFG